MAEPSSRSLMYAYRPRRALSATAALAVVGLMAALLALGLGVGRIVRDEAPLVSIALSPRPPPPVERPMRRVRPAKASPAKGRPSPPNLRNKATQVVAPPAPLPIVPPPIVAATAAGIGSAAETGASDRLGPGRGAGGIGDGDGGGGDCARGACGDSIGGGGSVVGPRRTRGRLSYGDLPEGLLALGEERSVEVRYTVEPDGRASHCRPLRSSGRSLLDTLACQLIEQRFRFRPARNRDGDPVRADIVETHTWVAEGEAPEGPR